MAQRQLTPQHVSDPSTHQQVTPCIITPHPEYYFDYEQCGVSMNSVLQL